MFFSCLEGPVPDIIEYTLLFINGTEINNVAADNVKNIGQNSVKSFWGSRNPESKIFTSDDEISH